MPEDLTDDLNLAAAPAHWGMRFTKTIHARRDPSLDPTDVKLPAGYTVVVTGAGKGIGEYIAKAYVEAKAQNIVITSRTESDLQRVKTELEAIAAKQNRTVNVTVCASDATDLNSYKAVAAILDKSYDGRLDCLVNNAGGGDMTLADRPLHEGDPKVFSNTTILNYFGPYYGAMTLMPFLLNGRGSGKTLINIISGAAHLIDLPPVSYNVAKLATARMTEIIAAAYSKDVSTQSAFSGCILISALRDPSIPCMCSRPLIRTTGTEKLCRPSWHGSHSRHNEGGTEPGTM